MRKVVCLSMGIAILVSGFFTHTLTANSSPSVAQVSSESILQSRNTINGFVFTENRQPVSDAHVELLDEFNMILSRTKTNGSGLFTFKDLSDGRYSVKASHLGADYEEQIRAVSLVSISAIPGRGAVNEQVDFYLKIRKKANNGPLAAPGVIFAQEIPNEAKKLYESGIDDIVNKKENDGFDKLKKALEMFPDYFLALDRLGTEYVVRGYYTPAYILLAKAVEINPRSFSSSFGLGLASYRLQRVDEAIDNLQRAVKIYNKSANAYLWLGIALHQNKKLSQAENALTQADKLSNGVSSEVHWQMARLYKDQNRFRESADKLELFLKYKPEVEDAEKIKDMIKVLRQKSDGK